MPTQKTGKHSFGLALCVYKRVYVLGYHVVPLTQYVYHSCKRTMHMAGLIQCTFTEVSLKVILFFKNSGTGETKIKVRSADCKGDNTLATFSIKN